SDDPAAGAIALERRAARLRACQEDISSALSAVDASTVADIQALVDSVVTLRDASRLLSAEAFSDEPVSGVGSAGWYELWRAARRFSETEAFPTLTYSTDLDRCVLCHQELSLAARNRMSRFTAFVTD